MTKLNRIKPSLGYVTYQLLRRCLPLYGLWLLIARPMPARFTIGQCDRKSRRLLYGLSGINVFLFCGDARQTPVSEEPRKDTHINTIITLFLLLSDQHLVYIPTLSPGPSLLAKRKRLRDLWLATGARKGVVNEGCCIASRADPNAPRSCSGVNAWGEASSSTY
jgi:hypothetical protein